VNLDLWQPVYEHLVGNPCLHGKLARRIQGPIGNHRKDETLYRPAVVTALEKVVKYSPDTKLVPELIQEPGPSQLACSQELESPLLAKLPSDLFGFTRLQEPADASYKPAERVEVELIFAAGGIQNLKLCKTRPWVSVVVGKLDVFDR
jgi:hypothetical protein